MGGYSQPIHGVRTLVDRTVSGVRQLIWEGIVPSTLARHRWCIVRTRAGALHFAYFHGLRSGASAEVPGFLATDLGVHADSRRFGGQREECDILGGACFYRGSQPDADHLLRVWSHHDLDGDWLWAFLVDRHAQLFGEVIPAVTATDRTILQRSCASLPLRRPRRRQAQTSDPS